MALAQVGTFATRLTVLDLSVEGNSSIVHPITVRAVVEAEDVPVHSPVGAVQRRLKRVIAIAIKPRGTLFALVAYLIVNDAIENVFTHA